MECRMKLKDKAFELVKSGIKHYEYRVNDEKRRLIKVGDIITFVKLPDEIETIKAIVLELLYYKNLLEMYTDTFNDYLFKYYDNPEDAVAATTYYSEDEINQYGCVAMKIKLVVPGDFKSL